MPTTLKIQSFSQNNIRERSSLAASAAAGQVQIVLESTEGFVAGDVGYLGALSREQCEAITVLSVDSSTQLTLSTPIEYDHPVFDSVTTVVGNLIRIYRAINVNGVVPADELFSVLGTRNIDPDQQSSYYTDSNGSSGFWYRSTYFNPQNMAETALGDSQAVLGDDFGHYATLSAIRAEAGFSNAENLNDVDVDMQRRAAESEINAALSGRLTVPFVKPVPAIIETITIKLAAGLLQIQAYGDQSRTGNDKVRDARAMLTSVSSGATSADDGTGINVLDSGVSGYPASEADGARMFTVDQRF